MFRPNAIIMSRRDLKTDFSELFFHDNLLLHDAKSF